MELDLLAYGLNETIDPVAQEVILNAFYIFVCILSLDIFLGIFRRLIYFAMTMFNHLDLSFFRPRPLDTFSYKNQDVRRK